MLPPGLGSWGWWRGGLGGTDFRFHPQPARDLAGGEGSINLQAFEIAFLWW